MRKTQIIGVLLITLLLVLGACAPAPTPAPEETPAPTPTPAPAPAPAEFKVISLDVVPPEVMAGEAVSITAVVKNIGGSEGTHAVILAVDGVTVEIKEVALTPGSSRVVTFSLVKEAPGTYEIGIGELSSSLVVKKELEINEVELKYDDGRPDGFMAIGGVGNGRLVQFSPPATPFTITKVKIFGNLYGIGYENLKFDVQIWDKDLKEIHSASYPHTKFSISPGWVVIDITDVVVGDTFYVLAITNSPREGGVTTGYDSSVKNEHSEVTKSYKVDWWISLPKETTNWMIRVAGMPMAPD